MNKIINSEIRCKEKNPIISKKQYKGLIYKIKIDIIKKKFNVAFINWESTSNS